MSLPAAGSITIHAQHPGLWKHPAQHFLHLLRAQAKSGNIWRAALRTDLRHGDGMTAVVTDQRIHIPYMIFVGSHGNFTMTTFYHKTTAAARNMSRISSPVQKKDRLLPSGQPFAYLLLQQAAEHGTVLRPQLIPQIHHMDPGHPCPSCALRQPV
jgi:hypothetical protein